MMFQFTGICLILLFCSIECHIYMRANHKLFMGLGKSLLTYLRIVFQKTVKLLIPIIQVTQPESCSLSVRAREYYKATPQREGISSRRFPVCEMK